MENEQLLKRNKSNIKVAPILRVILLAVFAIYTLSPLYLLVINSFKSNNDIVVNPFSFPKTLDWQYLANSFEKMHYFRAIGVTLLITVVSIFIIILLSSFSAWMLVRNSKRKQSKVIYLLFIAAMLIPFQSVMYPLINLFDSFGLKNIPGLIIMYAGFGLSLSVFLYYGFIQSVPREIEEAALIDGANVFQIFRHVTFPQLRGTTATVIILNSMWIWNDYLLPFLVIGRGDYKTLTLEVYFAKLTSGQYGNPYSFIFSSVLLSIIPIVIVFFALQKEFVAGVGAGAVKG